MPAPTLQQIETETQLVRELRRAAWSDLRDAFISPKVCTMLPDESRRVIVAAVEGYDRELEALATVEREILGNGKTSRRTESRFDASVPPGAPVTLESGDDATSAIRGASRGPVASSPENNPASVLPAAGEVF